MITVALVGAGGKMGCRITDNMKKQKDYRMLHVEVAEAGRRLFQPDWKRVFEPDSVKAQLDSILKPPTD